MNQSCKFVIAVFLNFAFLTNQILADLQLVDFEAAEWIPLDNVGLGSQTGWQLVSGTAKVSAAGEGFNGGTTGKALKIPVNQSQETRISRAIDWNVADQTAFIDFQFKPAADPVGSAATFVANGTQLAFQVQAGETKGQIWVLHGADNSTAPGATPEQWIQTAGTFDVPVGGTASSNYVRITMRHDYQRKLWDLFIDGKLAAANLDYDGRGTNLQSLEFYGSDTGNTFVDNLSAVTTNMLFADADKDGLSDAWELANGSNPNVYDRDTLKPGSGGSFLDAYMASLWNLRVSGSQANPVSGNIPALTIGSEAPHQAVGALKGSLSVGGDGSAGYSIPIDIPKGTGGMEPKLSLGYSSNSGNGMVGVGWNLAGLQRITRGPSSAAKDGNYDPMDFDSDDRFFLDGERLVCTSGTYGAAGSQYRTEMDSYARITAIGTGPESWKIETKAGLIVILGGSANSKIAVSQGTLAWGVTRVKDTVGNYYSVIYERDEASTNSNFINHRVSEIQYTGNEDELTDPYCSVNFSYEDRSDVSRANTTYAGYLSSKRLSKIRVKTGSYVNHAYRLGYVNSYQTGRSFLKTVTKYMQDSDALSIPGTTFTYDGLQDPGSTSINRLWENPGPTNLPVYGTNLDANDEVNSVVTVEEASTIKLVGDVSRAYDLPGAGIELFPNSRISFEFNSPKLLGTGAMIGLDSDTTYQSSDYDRFHHIGGSGSVGMGGGVSYNGPAQPYQTSNGWKPFDLPVAGSGTLNNLVLMCMDNEISDGVDSAYFRNVKIYRQSQGVENGIAVTFNVDQELPRYATSAGKDLGVVSLDINGDALPDITDWRVFEYENISGVLTAGHLV